MTRILWLVCDQSGSMVEEARRFILRNLVRGTEQFVRLRPGSVGELKVVGLRDTANVVEWTTDEEFPEQLLDCHATVDASALVDMAEVLPFDKMLIFSDGSWAKATFEAFESWRREKELSVRFIKIGSDSGTRLFGPDVFGTEDLIGALEGWITP